MTVKQLFVLLSQHLMDGDGDREVYYYPSSYEPPSRYKKLEYATKKYLLDNKNEIKEVLVFSTEETVKTVI